MIRIALFFFVNNKEQKLSFGNENKLVYSPQIRLPNGKYNFMLKNENKEHSANIDVVLSEDINLIFFVQDELIGIEFNEGDEEFIYE